MTEFGYSVAPLGTQEISDLAELFLRRVAPEHLEAPEPLDMAKLVDYGLQGVRIDVYPVPASELPDAEAETHLGPSECLDIWMRDDYFESLFEENSRTVRARSTLAHEIGHCVLHPQEVRTGRHCPHVLAMRRAPRSSLRPFEDSEWQAHAFAGALLIPLSTIRKIRSKDPEVIARVYHVSSAFVLSHLRRICRLL